MAWSTWSAEKKMGVVVGGLLLSGGAIWLVWWLIHRSSDSNGGGGKKNVNTENNFRGAAAARPAATGSAPSDIPSMLRQDSEASSQQASVPFTPAAPETSDRQADQSGAFPSTYLPSGYQLMGNLKTGQEDIDEVLDGREVELE